jgi:hypothetical protein
MARLALGGCWTFCRIATCKQEIARHALDRRIAIRRNERGLRKSPALTLQASVQCFERDRPAVDA